MCGIHFSISRNGFKPPDVRTEEWLKNRGPDEFKRHEVIVDLEHGHLNFYLSITSSVLSLRGEHVTTQPLIDDATGSILCWNGEAWRINNQTLQGNDAELVFKSLLKTVHDIPTSNETQYEGLWPVAEMLGNISGPFSFVFYDGIHRILFFGRDSLGRRSLLFCEDLAGDISISSISGMDGSNLVEIDADGIRIINLNTPLVSAKVSTGLMVDNVLSNSFFDVFIFPWLTDSEPEANQANSLHIVSERCSIFA